MCVLMCVTISMTDTMPCPQIQCSICSFDVHGVSIGLCVCIVHDVCVHSVVCCYNQAISSALSFTPTCRGTSVMP